MNPILMAAARGARIQWSGPHPEDGEWFPAKNIWFDTVDTHRRIHPNDEHLRFGPISTALREAAETPPADPWQHDDNYVLAAIEDGVWGDGHTLSDYQEADRLHRSLFLLILSEALADEGL